ncbi:unnamed protein product [Penicillium salamii]|nr:unnamed protein product [Penicillium salamii]CAG8295707.1 unnamed protein product [Penicillium salamii]CAG8400851.1 unnamed protein product [Penicillium salamii]
MSANDYTNFPPGTHLLNDRMTLIHLLLHTRSNFDTDNSNGNGKDIVLNPTPSDDPEDPLNWSTLRKTLNFGLTCTYVLFTFVLLDLGNVLLPFYEGKVPGVPGQLNLSLGEVTRASGASYAGLALGCLFTIPCVHKFGRRPLYLLSAVLQFACAIWYAKFKSAGEMAAIGLLAGLGGSVSEAIVMITVVDLFFVHQHARMNGLFLFMQALGALGGPIAAGYILLSMQWRWVWWITAIILGVNLLLVVFFFEESKYVPRSRPTANKLHKGDGHSDVSGASSSDSVERINGNEQSRSGSNVESQTYPRKTYFQRLALVTKSDIPILKNLYRPLVAPFMFPAVLFAALQYGIIQAWFSVTTTAGAQLLPKPPYNFKANEIGLYNIGGFIGSLIATFTVSFLSDWLAVWQSRRNKGVFEPEMRLWLLFPAILFTSIGSWVYGIGLNRGWHWAILAVGNGIFGFGFMVTADAALTYLTDSYPMILNDTLVSVVFIRNGLAMITKFPFSAWLDGMGVQNMFILIGVISLATMIMPALLMVYGKRARIHTAHKYMDYAAHQISQRSGLQQG